MLILNIDFVKQQFNALSWAQLVMWFLLYFVFVMYKIFKVIFVELENSKGHYFCCNAKIPKLFHILDIHFEIMIFITCSWLQGAGLLFKVDEQGLSNLERHSLRICTGCTQKMKKYFYKLFRVT